MRFQLYVDLDGVMVDFDRGYAERFGRSASKTTDDVDWSLVRSTPGFYRDLPLMPDALELWDFVRRFDPVFLTGVPISVPEAAQNKRECLDRHLGAHVPMIACLSRDKSAYCKPGDVIIDDWEKHRHLWVQKGGRWILHVSARQSILELQAMVGGE